MTTGKMVRVDGETHRLLCHYRDTLRACLSQGIIKERPEYLEGFPSIGSCIRYLLEMRHNRFETALQKLLENWEGEIP